MENMTNSARVDKKTFYGRKDLTSIGEKIFSGCTVLLKQWEEAERKTRERGGA